MPSTFYGLEIGRSGLNSSMSGLQITAHNIANVDTAGYTRQRLVTTAVDPYNVAMKWKNNETIPGGGVKNVQIDRIRSAYLDRQFRTQQTNYSYWSTVSQGLSYVESVFETNTAATIAEVITNFFGAINDATIDATDESARTTLRQAGISLCTSFNLAYEQLVDLQKAQNTAVETTVADINSILNNIAILNRAIYKYEIDNINANDLRDKRDLLLDELSSLVNIKYYETSDNKMVVTLAGGQELVSHTSVNELQLVSGTDPTTDAAFSYPGLDDGNGNIVLLTASELKGELGANMDLRDSADSDVQGIPYYMQQLNTMVRAIAEAINSVHSAGYTYPSGGNDSVNGVNFFKVPVDANGDPDYSQITAGNFSISKELQDSVWNIAASANPIDLDPDSPTYNPGDQTNLEALYDVINKSGITLSDGTSIGSLYGYMSGIITGLATHLKACEDYTDNFNIQLLSVDTARTSVAGVSLDEEMTNLIQYQHAYSGASRVITAMDDALDTLINKMGRVGL